MKLTKVLIISGGSGSNFIHKSLIKEKRYEINYLINLYDDGKSTGEIRKYLNYKILGPSDLRKIQGLSYTFKNNKNDLYNFFNLRLSSNNFYNKQNLKKNNLIDQIINYNSRDFPNKIKNYINKALKLFFNSKN